jgi:indolepyruvate ferredoxin oxidoreductase alpha subunit
MKRQKAVFWATRCYTLATPRRFRCLILPLHGGLLHSGQGIHLVSPIQELYLVGINLFPQRHSGGINAVYNNTDITLIVLDNSTTAMTGHQPHPGTGKTMMGEIAPYIDIAGILKACGVQHVAKSDPLRLEEAMATVQEAADYPGVSAVIFESPCIALYKPSQKMTIDECCVNCKKCIREIGCPALAVREGQVRVDEALCTGCGLSAQLSPWSHEIGVLQK